MAINSLLSTTESKKQTANRQKRNRIIDMEIIWRVTGWEGEGEVGRMREKYRE